MVEPGVQPPRTNSNSPCGNSDPLGGGDGGLAGSPLSGMKLAAVKEHVGPPPVKTAAMVPLPVAEGAMYDRAMRAGVTLTAAEGGPWPSPLIAVTVQL